MDEPEVFFQAIPSPTGPYLVGCLDLVPKRNLNPNCPMIRIFYPTVIDSILEKWETANWFPHTNYALAYFKFSGLPNAQSLADFAMKADIKTPAVYGSPLVGSAQLPTRATDQTVVDYTDPSTCAVLPIIVFSHGRGGMRTQYSGICSDLASHGYLVAVPEHLDQSACIALQRTTTDKHQVYEDVWIPYCWKFEEPELVFRNKQVQQRSSELISTIDVLENLNAGIEVVSVIDAKFDLLQFKGRLQMDRTAIMGHSFGGASIIHCLTEEKRFLCGVALDPWMMTLSEDIFVNGISQPLIFINTASYMQPSGIERIMKLVKPANETGISSCHMVTIKGTIHRNQSDSIFILSSLLKERPTLDPYTAHSVNMSLCLSFLQRFLHDNPKYKTCVPILDGGVETPEYVLYGTNVLF